MFYTRLSTSSSYIVVISLIPEELAPMAFLARNDQLLLKAEIN
jgi:hypothetical protein